MQRLKVAKQTSNIPKNAKGFSVFGFPSCLEGKGMYFVKVKVCILLTSLIVHRFPVSHFNFLRLDAVS